MAITTRQSTLLVNQDWTKIYQSFREADFESYDFQTLRKAMIDYLRTYYPEDFNDFIESSEYVALIDLIAFLGQSLAFRTDLNARENFIDTAERRDSVLKLARLISYNPKRNLTSTGLLKFNSISTTETLYDSNGLNLSNLVIKWNDTANANWLEQFTTILNASLVTNQVIGKPSNTASIAGINTDEYQINLLPNTLPVFKFAAIVEGVNLPFEVVSATTSGQQYVYENNPRPGRTLGFLYQNDNLGNNSNNTGYFFYFKQGILNSVDFTLADSLPNRVVNLNYDNINNTDVWLYSVTNNIVDQQWSQVPAVSGVNIIYNNTGARNSFQVNSRGNDQVDLVFGDGTFASIPQGAFRAYYRQSVGQSYKITPDEMQNIQIPISYVSSAGRLETLTVTASLQYTVANATARESIDEIRTKAPQQYYTQNRMVTGEDYNILPYTTFNSISKVKAVNRTSSGISRYLDVVDVTGKYSSTNIFSNDGFLYKEYLSNNFNFTWNSTQDILRVIDNRVLPELADTSLLHFYYDKFTRYTLSNVRWKRYTSGSGESTGEFVNPSGNTVAVGAGTGSPNQFVNQGSIVIFSPGTGNYFNAQNEIRPLPASGLIPLNGKALLYATVVKLTNNGTGGIGSDGTGPVGLSVIAPTGAIATQVIPAFSNTFNTAFKQLMITQISNYRNFGIGFNQATKSWYIIESNNLNLTDDFSLTNAQSTTGLNADSSWLLAFTVSGVTYSAAIRGLDYVFESKQETKFYFDKSVKIFDPSTGLTVNDNINVLKINGDPDTSQPLPQDAVWFVSDQVSESDGYVNQSKVLVTFSDSDADGIPDNPDLFTLVVAPEVNSQDKYVFFQKTYGYNSFVTFTPIDNTQIVSTYATLNELLPHLGLYSAGQVWYTSSTNTFYIGTLVNNVLTPVITTDYLARVGRQNLYFQYKHNSPNSRRIDPSPNNIIDLYILTKQYETDYRAWALDNTGTVVQPAQPTLEQLNVSYGELNNYKSVSDALIFNPAVFKPLFGAKADPKLQATFKVIRNPNVNVSDSEVISQVLSYINLFFSTNNWDFGDTFYFSELAAFIHTNLAPTVASVIIVPNDANETYGSLQQISSEANEILISCATAENIEVISSITAAQLNLQNLPVNTITI